VGGGAACQDHSRKIGVCMAGVEFAFQVFPGLLQPEAVAYLELKGRRDTTWVRTAVWPVNNNRRQ
jgi:hypothetical protein